MMSTNPLLSAPFTHSWPRPSDAGHSRSVVRHGVLVVDDDPEFARSVAETLADRDLECITAKDAQDALGLVRLRPFAVAMVDLIMPGMDGLELTREIRRASPSTEIVMLTGHADMRSAIEAMRNEVFDFLEKDQLHSARLRRAARAAIARSELRAENLRLVTGLQDTARKLSVLSDIGQRLAAETHLDRLLPELTQAARELLEVESARVLIMEHNELGDLTIRAASGDGEIAIGGRFGAGDGIAGHVLDTARPVCIDVAADHPNYSARCDELRSTLRGFICVPLQRPTLAGVLAVAGRARAFTDEDVSLLASLARQGAVAMENASSAEVNRNFFTHASELLVGLLDAEDVHYEGHSHAVAALTDMVTRRLGMPEQERRTLHFAGLLHDVGKLRLSDVLRSPGPLTVAEREAIRQHPALGVEILRPISLWRSLAPAIHTHHERWDGKGYPRGLSGTEIPVGGRIIAVAEAFEAMTRALPHRPGRSVEDALAEVLACAGTQFDPEIAAVFVEECRVHRDRLPCLGRRP